MNNISIILLLIVIVSCSKTNTKGFFEQKIGHDILFQTYSGYEEIDWYYPSGTTGMYYSFFQSSGSERNISDKNVPLILWLEGGPGSSSQKGAFTMVGPLSINGKQNNYSINQNPWHWSVYGHMLFVDQPLEVGFSYNKNKRVDSTYDAAHHVINFLHNFYQQWGLRQNPLYIAGLSYAGHYIPVIARNILTNVSLDFNLKGIMIGGAWIHPEVQVNFVDSFMYSVGIVSEAGRSTSASIQNQAILSILNGKYAQAGQFANWIQDEQVNKKYFGGVDLSNYRFYDHSNINQYYGGFLQANKKEFGVSDEVSFKSFNTDIYNAFVASGDFAKSMGDEVDFILNRGLRTLFFNGQNDVQVPTASVLTFLNTIQWHELQHWQRVSKQHWTNVFSPGGWVKKYSNFAFVFVQNAGHLTPADQPRATLTILNNFIHGIW